jgi:hypothetical protein
MKRILLWVWLAATLSGCSFFTMERAGRQPPQAIPECTASWKPIATDVLWAVTYGLVGANEARQEPSGERTTLALAAPPIVVFLASAVDGLVIRRNCIRKRAAHDRWVAESGGG